jgi:N-acetyl-alpha-D-glucosaminyl L-malate synthase BshA
VRSLRIGLVCHSTLGGSGVIATELGHALAERGHHVHFFCADAPPRLDARAPRITLHTVKSPVHALFPGGEYTLALASALAEASAAERLDVLNVHYAIPHATSAYLARQLLGAAAPKLVTTLHGTDVLTLGVDPALRPVVRHSICASDALTVPSRYLRDEVVKAFSPPPGTGLEVIGNFVDTERFKPAPRQGPRVRTLLHTSSFRPLKRVDDVVRVLAEVRKRVPAELVLVGDGPTRREVEALVKSLGLSSAVRFMGEQTDVTALVQASDVFLFPSQTESFGLAALEALACGVPVIATRTGGLPELIDDGATGFLQPVGDVAGMAARAVQLLTDDATWARFSAAARTVAQTRWRVGPQVDRYEATYRRVLARGP